MGEDLDILIEQRKDLAIKRRIPFKAREIAEYLGKCKDSYSDKNMCLGIRRTQERYVYDEDKDNFQIEHFHWHQSSSDGGAGYGTRIKVTFDPEGLVFESKRYDSSCVESYRQGSWEQAFEDLASSARSVKEKKAKKKEELELLMNKNKEEREEREKRKKFGLE